MYALFEKPLAMYQAFSIHLNYFPSKGMEALRGVASYPTSKVWQLNKWQSLGSNLDLADPKSVPLTSIQYTLAVN